MEKQMEQRMREVLSQVFTSGQIKVLMNPTKKRVTWSSEDIANAISLRCISPKAYRYLRNVLKFPLPGLSTLHRWVSNINIYQGVLTPVLRCMHAKGRIINAREKLVVLTFDEIYLNNKIAIDRKIEQDIGQDLSVCNGKEPVF